MLEKKHTFLFIAAAVCLGGILYALVAPTIAQKKIPSKANVQTDSKKLVPQKIASMTRTIKVTNKIEKKMTGYRKMGKTWYPDEWSLSVNGIEIASDAQTTITACTNGTCKLIFAYDFRPFGTSYKKGTEELEFAIPASADELEITFSWLEKPNIRVAVLKQEKPVGKESILL